MSMLCVVAGISYLAQVIENAVSQDELQEMLRINPNVCKMMNCQGVEQFTSAVIKACIDYKRQLELEARAN